jgi:hypothetical protein
VVSKLIAGLILIGVPRRYQSPDLIGCAATPHVQRVRTDLDNRLAQVADIVKQVFDQPIGLPANISVPLINGYRPVITVIGSASVPDWLTAKKVRLFRDRV